MAAFAKRLQNSNAIALTDVEVLASPEKVAAPSTTTDSARSHWAVPTVEPDAEEDSSSVSVENPDESVPDSTTRRRDMQDSHNRAIDEL